MAQVLFSYFHDSRIHIRQSAYKVTDNFLISFFTDQFRSIISHYRIEQLCKELSVEIDHENCEFNWTLMF